MSGWTVCYSGEKSCDSVKAMLRVSRQVSFQRSVFSMNIPLSTYRFFLRSSEVRKVDTSVGQGYSNAVK